MSDTSSSPFAPMIVIPRRDQGFVGKGSSSLNLFIKHPVQLVGPFSLIPIELSQVPHLVVQDGADQGEFATPDVFGRHFSVPPEGSVEVGSAVAIDKCHCVLRSPVCPVLVPPRFGGSPPSWWMHSLRGGPDHGHDAGADGGGEAIPGGHDGGQVGVGG
jgi:hypothetical protein